MASAPPAGSLTPPALLAPPARVAIQLQDNGRSAHAVDGAGPAGSPGSPADAGPGRGLPAAQLPTGQGERLPCPVPKAAQGAARGRGALCRGPRCLPGKRGAERRRRPRGRTSRLPGPKAIRRPRELSHGGRPVSVSAHTAPADTRAERGRAPSKHGHPSQLTTPGGKQAHVPHPGLRTHRARARRRRRRAGRATGTRARSVGPPAHAPRPAPLPPASRPPDPSRDGRGALCRPLPRRTEPGRAQGTAGGVTGLRGRGRGGARLETGGEGRGRGAPTQVGPGGSWPTRAGSVRRSSWGAGSPRASPPTRAGSGRRRTRCPCAYQWWPRARKEASTSPPPSSGGRGGARFGGPRAPRPTVTI